MRRLLQLLVSLVFVAQTGCGGGGGGDGGATVTTISGTASKGIIKNGAVKIYAINADGSRGRLLAETTTDDKGRYSKAVTNYSGPVMACAFGSYTDEATGATVTLTEANALRAALPALSGTAANLPITALTEVAVRKAGTLTPAAIASANALVASLFNVNITGSNPVEASEAAMSDATVTSEQLDYTLALAALSEMAQGSSGTGAAEKLETALTTLCNGITATTIEGQTAKAFVDATGLFLDNHVAINSVVSNRGGSPIITVGSKKARIVLSLAGVGSSAYGAQFTIVLPPGVSVAAKADGALLCGVLGLAHATAGASSFGTYTPATATSSGTVTTAVASGTSLGSGEFLIINANVAAGTVLGKNSFTVSTYSVFDGSGGIIGGYSLTVSDLILS